MISNPMSSLRASRGANLVKERFFRDTLYIVESQIEIYNTLVDEQVLGWPQEFRFDIIINILNKIEKTGGHPLFYAD